METVGFIGLGNMGGGMSANIQRAGYPMIVYDLREEAALPLLEGGARLANTPSEVAATSDVTFTSLPGPYEVEAVSTGADGVLEGIKPGSVYIDLSSSRPTLIREIEPKFRAKGCHVLDAPVSGGKTGAASGNLAVMVGGDREVFDRVKPILDSFGDKVFYAGEIGAGSVAKLVHNMIGHSVRQAIAEGLTLGSQGRRGAGGPVGMRAPRFAGSDASAARGAGADDVPGRVRAGELRAEPGLQGHFAGDGIGARIRRADADVDAGRADRVAGDESRLGRVG